MTYFKPEFLVAKEGIVTGKTEINHSVRIALHLTMTEYAFLAFLDYRRKKMPLEEIKQPDVYAWMGTKALTVNRIIGRLQAKGMITKVGLVDENGDIILVWKTKQSTNEKVQQPGTRLIPTDKWYNAFKKVKVSKPTKADGPVKVIVIPSEKDFMDYCKSIEGMPNGYEAMEFALRAKYESWKDNKWKDGHNKDIKNWRSKIKNTIPFLKPDWSKVKKEEPGTGSGVTNNEHWK